MYLIVYIRVKRASDIFYYYLLCFFFFQSARNVRGKETRTHPGITTEGRRDETGVCSEGQGKGKSTQNYGKRGKMIA